MKATCYLQVQPTFSGYTGEVRSIAVIRVTSKRPTRPVSGVVVVKITMDIADKAFMPLTPSVEITIPAEHTEAIQIVSEPMEILE